MAEEQKFIVVGNYKGTQVKEIVSAFSMEQAKFRAGLRLGIAPSEMKDFMRKVRARRK